MIRILIMFAVSILLFSCSKEDDTKLNTESGNNQKQESSEDDSDTTMTAEEAFSSALVLEILGDQEDPELQEYLEEQIYPIVSKSDKVTIDRISASLYLLSYYDGGSMKNILIQKFYNPAEDEFAFEKKETDLNSMRQFVR